MISRKVFQSAHLLSADYNPSLNELSLTFLNGSVRRYRMVPARTWQELSKASSPGEYFHKQIKTRFPLKKEPAHADD